MPPSPLVLECWFVCLAGMAAPLAAQSPAALGPRVVTAHRIAGSPPRIDGRLDDPVWAQAEPVTDFVQSTPNPGALATLPSTARVLYDDDALYVALRLSDPHPDSIVAPYPRRDDETTSDWTFVEVDSRLDHRTGFSFGVNPRGVQADGAWTDDVDYDGAWNAIWEAAAAIDSLGWTAEFRIPFSQLPL
ncbi:MAG TPA: carbohydrate binding family 9 domain-containing protein, partial [Gemmatimonadales bacterium]|nr:carbohydrate binding family 9 domain-containing protein [Gemmatimonadales bacterium]